MAGVSELTVLIVDDNPQMRTIIGTVLAAIGVRKLHYAQDGMRGLEAVESVKPDLVYVDYEMPFMNGLEFTLAVRASQGPDRFLPIIVLTGHSDVGRLRLARDAGMNEFVTKPVSAKTIVDRLNAVIMFPRPFISSSSFFGPDRRRRSASIYQGPFRRAQDENSSSVREDLPAAKTDRCTQRV